MSISGSLRLILSMIFMICKHVSVTSALQDTWFDEFVIAHTLGWWGKAIMIRNLPLLWILSIGFEMAEVIYFSCIHSPLAPC